MSSRRPSEPDDTDARSEKDADPTVVRQRSASLFRFLRDLTALRTRATLTYPDDMPAVWIGDVPNEPECVVDAWKPQPSRAEENDNASPQERWHEEAWLRIDKPALEDAPLPPAALEPWLVSASITDSSKDTPEIIELRRIPRDDDPETIDELAFDDDHTAQQAYRYFVRERWLPWALEDRRLRRVQRVYAKLFAMHQRQVRYGESEQVVLGLGLLDWAGDGDKRPRRHRHLIAAEAAIEIDSRSGAISVGPGEEGAAPRLEQDMLDPSERPSPEDVVALERRVRALGDDVVAQADEVHAIASAWVHATAADGQYDSNLTRPQAAAQALLVSYAPAILVRKRSDRALLNTFGEILETIDDGKVPIPFGVARYVSVDAAPAPAPLQTTEVTPPADDTVDNRDYLPLLANREQRRVLDRLRQQQGVLVQGPPGTGKSHTIANLVCHLLATGQRVLVTSHTAHALEVLRDKLPEGFADLCVELLGSGRGAMQSLERSVQAITERQQSFDAEQSSRQIDRLEQALQESHADGARARLELRDVQEASAQRHALDYDGLTFSGTLLQLAAQIDASPVYRSDDVVEENCSDPLDDTAHTLLLDTRPGPRPRSAGYALRSAATFDPAARFAEEASLAVIAAETPHSASQDSATDAGPTITADSIATIAERALAVRSSWSALERAGGDRGWVRDAIREMQRGRGRAWHARADSARALTTSLPDAADLDRHRVAGLDRTGAAPETIAADAIALRQHLEAGGGFGWLIFRSAVVKRTRAVWENVTVDGRACTDAATLSLLETTLEADRSLAALDAAWSDLEAPSPGQARSVRAALHAERLELLESALELQEQFTALEQTCTAASFETATSSGTSALVAASASLGSFEDWVDRVVSQHAAAKLRALRAAIERDAQTLDGNENEQPHPDEAALAAALRARDIEACRVQIERLQELDDVHAAIDRYEAAGAPSLAAALRRADPELDRSTLRSVWATARAAGFVRARVDSAHERSLRSALETAQHAERDALGALAEARAWHGLLTELDEHERQHLVAWSKAVRRIGKGTGKHAARHRRAAREHMEQCRGAIPAWILPTYRVAESLRPGVDNFDVVIIDEASQSGPEALFLLYMCKKIIVVGDDKQISPDFVGITRDDVEHLRKRHLKDLPHADAYSLEHSLFDLAEIRYGDRIRLREHFRCMPEIIRFSNDLCYASEPLVPLKQFGAGRLTPVIRSVQVEEGYRDGTDSKVFNPPEADAIVEQIAQCCEDPDYTGKSMGVISLQGPHQAQLIEGKLMERLGPDVILERDLVCGDAYAFQGDERDVMFLSLVAAPHAERRIGTLADQRSERRFNVAVSRAKEQMWLFHSVTLGDLSRKCLRYALLEYCMDPTARSTLPAGVDLDALRTTAAAADRSREDAPAPFDSWFEVDVCTALAGRGFRVEPQYEVAGFSIDLVVIGATRRLAVECDGDAWHGPEQWADDDARQRALERCGWTFCRIRGSAYYLDPSEALSVVWEALQRLGIEAVAFGAPD